VAIGADGVPGGWIAAACHAGEAAWGKARSSRRLPPPGKRRVELHLCRKVGEIAELRAASEAIVAIDVPIGLPEHGGARPCDTEARRLLGKLASSVFNPPARYLFPALDKATGEERWQEAQRLVREQQAKYGGEPIVAVSRQAVGILEKVRDADTYLRRHPDAEDWLIECHPEVSFLRMNGGEPLAPKAKAKGALQRLALVEREFPGTTRALEERELAEHVPLAERVPLADLLDAHAARRPMLAGLWSRSRPQTRKGWAGAERKGFRSGARRGSTRCERRAGRGRAVCWARLPPCALGR